MNIEERISASLGIHTLLPMQQEMLSLPLPAKVMLTAATGSGKTLAFAIVVLRTLRRSGEGVQSLVIAPTRELVLQIFEIIRTLAAPEYKTTAVYGGHSFSTEAASLGGNPDIVVGTPGRLLDHLRRGRLNIHDTRTLVIDEYDKSLELGFTEEMRAVVGRMKNVSTMVLTSATSGDIPDFVGAVDHKFEYTGDTAAEKPDIRTYRVDSSSPDKLDTLGSLLRSIGDRKTIVFLNHRDAAERVFNYLHKENFPVILYHGGLEQQMRERALILFENGTCPILVSTDLAARGLDIADVEAVVHYHLPVNAEAWTHRNGRTGRMGKSGNAYVIISEHDKVPEFVDTEEIFTPSESADTERKRVSTLYFNVGKKDKISRGDIVGFLCQKGGLEASEIGRIDIKDHCAYIAVPADKARATAQALAPYKIKNTRVRVTQLKTIF